MATPGVAAVLAHGGIPPLKVTALGVLTAFAGYTAVYALNDLVDYRNDRDRVRSQRSTETGSHLDAVFVRHPMALGLLSFKAGLAWAAAWAAAALIGAYILNPVCAWIFLAACMLETVYCLMLKVSHLRAVVSGMVKTSGALAAVFAVDPAPSWGFLAVLFLWLFFWEIGGQNVPNDLIDLEEDRLLRAKTIPVRLGVNRAVATIMVSLGLSVGLSLCLPWVAPGGSDYLLAAGISLAGICLLLIPAHRLHRQRLPAQASTLFNRASFYPLAVLLTALSSSILA
jgi:4-hydroxybenzoate polyprenyltransferase